MSPSPDPGAGDRPPAGDVPSLQRLDPDRSVPPAGAPASPTAAPTAPPTAAPAASAVPSASAEIARAAVDTRRYRWIIGIVGLAVVIGISVYQFATHGIGTTGVPPGQRLHLFAAPLAVSDLDGDPNPHPTCTPARHDPRALNICLLTKRAPLVVAFFVTGARQCVRQVDALQVLSRRFPAVQFAAVAVGAGHAATARLVRAHGWTIPVAYDRDGRVGALYGVAACPMAELAYRGGVVADRLIGDRWQSAAALSPRVRELVAPARSPAPA